MELQTFWEVGKEIPASHGAMVGGREVCLETIYLWESYTQWLRGKLPRKLSWFLPRARRGFLVRKGESMWRMELRTSAKQRLESELRASAKQRRGLQRRHWCHPLLQDMLTPRQSVQEYEAPDWLTFPHSVIKCLSSTSIKVVCLHLCYLMQDNQLSWKKKKCLSYTT